VLRLCECLRLPNDAINRLALDSLDVLYKLVTLEFDGIYSDPNLVGGFDKRDKEEKENSVRNYRYEGGLERSDSYSIMQLTHITNNLPLVASLLAPQVPQVHTD
jgi:hypothetical protein